MTLENLRNVLLSVVSKVYYATNEYDNEDNSEPPFIVYQETGKRASSFAEDKPVFFTRIVQLTLVSKKKDVSLEKKVEKALLGVGLVPENLSEFHNEDGSINKVYEVRLEEFIYG
jgi:hypothetical protein